MDEYTALYDQLDRQRDALLAFANRIGLVASADEPFDSILRAVEERVLGKHNPMQRPDGMPAPSPFGVRR